MKKKILVSTLSILGITGMIGLTNTQEAWAHSYIGEVTSDGYDTTYEIDTVERGTSEFSQAVTNMRIENGHLHVDVERSFFEGNNRVMFDRNGEYQGEFHSASVFYGARAHNRESDQVTIQLARDLAVGDVVRVRLSSGRPGEASNILEYQTLTVTEEILDPPVDPDPEATEGLEFSFNSDTREATVSGYTGSSQEVIIPFSITRDNMQYTVTSVGRFAFSGSPITHVIIPDSVTTIENSAFSHSHLTSVEIPDSVTTIGNHAFVRSRLTDVRIGNSVETIGDNAFATSHLTNVEFGHSVRQVGREAFARNNLTHLVLPDSIEIIREHSFSQNNLTSVNLGNSIETIERNAFSDNQLTHIKIPNSVTTMGWMAFARNRLTEVELSNSLTVLENYVFSFNQLTHIEIPNSIRTIREGAFQSNQLTNLEIPNSVTFIGSIAFVNNQLTSLEIPSSVTRVDFAAFRNNRLTDVTMSNSTRTVASQIFAGNPLQFINVPLGTSSQMSGTLEAGMNGVTTQTILREEATHYYQWNGIDRWIGLENPGEPDSYPDWDSYAFYTMGDRVIFNDQIWEALQTFQGHGDLNWAPGPETQALWRLIGDVQ